MASINLKRFVDINIKQHVPSVVLGTRDTVVLFTSEGSSSDPIDVTSYSDALAKLTSTTYATTLKYLNIYFACGGVKARVIGNTSTLTENLVSGLGDEYIMVASTNAGYATLKSIAQAREASQTIYGINEKILFARTSTASDADFVKNFAVKYASDNYVGAEMSIAAYLSQINVYGVDTVYDYAYTVEPVLKDLTDPSSPVVLYDAEDISDDTYGTIITNNMNVNVYLAGAVRDCGGNLKNGADVVNSFVRIILHQTLTGRLIALMTEHLKGTSGLGKIYATTSQELEMYKTAGYLSTDKIWTDNTLKVTYNNVTYTIIEKGTALTNGYLVKVLPYAALTDQQKALHQAPPIYVIIADQYGIRSITIQGDVI